MLHGVIWQYLETFLAVATRGSRNAPSGQNNTPPQRMLCHQISLVQDQETLHKIIKLFVTTKSLHWISDL